MNINKTTVSSNCGYVKASVEATLIVAYKLAQEWQNSQLVSPSNIQNSSNNDGLEFYNAGQYFESDCVGNSSNIKNMHKTTHAMLRGTCTVKKFKVTLTIFRSPQLHSFSVCHM